MEKDKGWVVACAVGVTATRRRAAALMHRIAVVVVILVLLLPWPATRGVKDSGRLRLSCDPILVAAQEAVVAPSRGKKACYGCRGGDAGHEV